MKKIASGFLAIMMVSLLTLSAFATSVQIGYSGNGPQPRLTGMISGNGDMTFESNGEVNVWGDITVREGYTGKIEAILQKSSDGVSGWTKVQTFKSSPIHSTSAVLDGTIYVTSNYSYRTKFQFYCYNSAGSLVDSPSIYVYP